MLTIGSKIIATKTVGPVREGTQGVVADVTQSRFLFFWSRRVYLCTFAGHISLAVRPDEIDDRAHRPTPWRSFRTS